MRHIILLAAAAAAPAWAQSETTAPPPPPVMRVIAAQPGAPVDPEALEAALALFEGKDLKALMLDAAVQMTNAALQVQIDHYREQDIELPPDLIARIQQLAFEEAVALVDVIAPTAERDIAAIYARFFTADELREIKKIQANPVAQKMERLSPMLFAEFGKISMAAVAGRREEMKQKIDDLVEQWLAEQLANEAPPKT